MNEGTPIILRPAVGDLVVFDQRITHMASWSGGYDRLLICMGYGVKNIFLISLKKTNSGRTYKMVLSKIRKLNDIG